MTIKIFIDQGHNPTNYHNSGAVGNGLYEQDITYQVGVYLAEMLSEDPRFEVMLSRSTPDTVLGTNNATSLAERVRMANHWPADISSAFTPTPMLIRLSTGARFIYINLTPKPTGWRNRF